MTSPSGWPDPARVDGWHWLTDGKRTEIWGWCGVNKNWTSPDSFVVWTETQMNIRGWSHVCPCVAARDTEIATLRERVKILERALRGIVGEFDKFSRYGSPMARAANESVNAARAALAPPEEK